ncbi:unnamed protein product [Paramecium pentaurelia]|uniref:Uncharacterized protein n=1 Tax=Paramecium pentaurelia TaxID=43138 RepID=A0A8S1YJF0_9CILI|nr:unnamed protein product [Paramecium pentaurelia]
MMGYEKNDQQVETLIGIILMISVAICSSIIQVLINTLAKYVNQLVILQYFCIITIGAKSMNLFIFPSKQWVIPNNFVTTMLIMIGVTSYITQLLMNRAYIKREISMLGQSQVIFGYIIDLFMGTNMTIFSSLGKEEINI